LETAAIETTAPAVGHEPRASRSGTVALALASLLGLVAYLYPFWLPAAEPAAETAAHAADAPLLLLALGVLVAVALSAEARAAPGRSASKLVALLGVLVAVNSALRLLPVVGGASPIFLLILLVGYAYGATYGFLMGSLSLFVSALVTGGVGPWLPYQMLGAGWMGMAAGWLPDLRRRPAVELATLAALGAAWGLLYGALLNLWFWPFLSVEGLGRAPGEAMSGAIARYGAFYILTSFWYDLFRSVATAALVLVLGRPLLRVLRRYRRRFAWIEVTSEGRVIGGASRVPERRPAVGESENQANDVL
jgi:energy-coupling factor transport system substrate-specific component